MAFVPLLIRYKRWKYATIHMTKLSIMPQNITSRLVLQLVKLISSNRQISLGKLALHRVGWTRDINRYFYYVVNKRQERVWKRSLQL